ncbi:hypothetical protein AMECASPLE_028550, partial [Ameca splendens]
ETTAAFRQQRQQTPGALSPATQAVVQREEEEEGAAAAPPQTPERKPDKSSNPFKTEEQSSWSPNFWGSTGVRTRSKKMKTTTGLRKEISPLLEKYRGRHISSC